jgi:alginate O-acetyltransferase complex protein AlgI
MLFTDGNYLVFLVAVFFIYWALAAHIKRVPVLFLATTGCYFYALSSPKCLLIILAIATVDFLTARGLNASTRQSVRKALLWTSITTDLGALFVFKYFNFFSDSVRALLQHFGLKNGAFLIDVVWPLGLSFITFRSLGHVIDAYRGEGLRRVSYLEYLAYVTFFPVIAAGPVVRSSELIPQFRQRPSLSSDKGSQALFLILIGFIKKIAIADYLANNLVGRVFDEPQLYSSLETLTAIYGYAIQIYCDFSGYSDIAIGSALLLGFELPPNFNAPYLAQNLIDFWRRWHITLSRWLTDYLYFSIGGLKKSRFNAYRNVVVTMLVGGLWHGAAWTFVLWGGLHGVGLAATRWWQSKRREARRSGVTPWRSVLAAIVTFNFVCFTWVFFRAESIGNARVVFSRLAALRFEASNLTPSIIVVLMLGVFTHLIPDGAFTRVSSLWKWLPSPAQALVIVALAIGLFYLSGVEVQFIYGQF